MHDRRRCAGGGIEPAEEWLRDHRHADRSGGADGIHPAHGAGVSGAVTSIPYLATISQGLLLAWQERAHLVGVDSSIAPMIQYAPGHQRSQFVINNYRLAPGSGPLPEGLLLDAATGVIAGTPTEAGNITLTVVPLDN